MDAARTLAGVLGPPLVVRPEGRIPAVDWWITSHCNLACDFCFGPVPGRDPVERREAILRALAASSAEVVTFCGGEPLLIREIGQYAADLRQRQKTTVLNTNGQLLRRCLDRGLELTDFTMVGISIDGPVPVVHSAMRGRNANLDEALAAARLVKNQPGVRLKIATVISDVNRDALPALARIVHSLRPEVWRLYQYSRRGDQNFGQQRHSIANEEFQLLAKEAANLAAPLPTAPSTEAETEGCLIVDPAGNVLLPTGDRYERIGNCLEKPLDEIWASIPAQETIIDNKRWLSILK